MSVTQKMPELSPAKWLKIATYPSKGKKITEFLIRSSISVQSLIVAVETRRRQGGKTKPILRCHKTTFYSHLDEEIFFDALEKISAIKKTKGEGPYLPLSVTLRASEKSLRELLAIFFRYKINMKQIAQFQTNKNQHWFCDSKAYWHKKIFFGNTRTEHLPKA